MRVMTAKRPLTRLRTGGHLKSLPMLVTATDCQATLNTDHGARIAWRYGDDLMRMQGGILTEVRCL